MLFHFLKYLQPTHYFQLFTKGNTSIFPIVKSVPEAVLSQLTIDTTYTSAIAQDYDLSWQAVQKGYIGEAPTYTTFEKLSVLDNYHFIRKYFNKAWVFYVLLLRLFSFHNPFIEVAAWLKTRQVQRISIGSNPIVYSDWNTFESALIKENQKVSVVIPTLNRYDYLKAVLKDLEQQDYSNFEVIVVDQSEPFHPDFYKDYTLDINLVRQEEKALWLARNNAIKNAKGVFIALSEDDVRIAPNWISSHLKCLDYFKAEVSAGVFYPEGKEIPKDRSFFAIASQFATGNAMLYKTVFKNRWLI